jgi:hypothetical protein
MLEARFMVVFGIEVFATVIVFSHDDVAEI